MNMMVSGNWREVWLWPKIAFLLNSHNTFAQEKFGAGENNFSWRLQSWDRTTRHRTSQAQATCRFGGEESTCSFFSSFDRFYSQGQTTCARCTHLRACQNQGWNSLEELAGCTGGAPLRVGGTLLIFWGVSAEIWTLLELKAHSTDSSGRRHKQSSTKESALEQRARGRARKSPWLTSRCPFPFLHRIHNFLLKCSSFFSEMIPQSDRRHVVRNSFRKGRLSGR